MDDSNKVINKTLTKIVDKFAAVATAYSNGLATEDQLKKNACSHIGVLMRLNAVEGLKVQHLVDEFIAVIKSEAGNIEEPINKVCGDLYEILNTTKE